MTELWKSLEQVEIPPRFLSSEDLDHCFFARDYVSRGGYDASTGNSLVQNFKKDPSKRARPREWAHRDRAVRQFATELNAIIGDHCVAAIPSSSLPSDTDYTNRFEDLFDVLRTLRPDNPPHVETPIRRGVRVEPVHVSEARRSVSDVYASLRWEGFDQTPNRLILVDDVITCGTHFKACQRLLLEHHPDIEIFGVFWARTVWPD